MGKAKKAKLAAMSQDRRNLKAKAAGGARATAGRSRIFADKGDILAKSKGDAEISEGLEEYQDMKHGIQPAPEAPKIPPTFLLTVNVIQYFTPTDRSSQEIRELVSFPEDPKGIEAAEDLFRDLCKKHGPQAPQPAWLDEDVETMIEDGWAEYMNWKVVIFHSTPPAEYKNWNAVTAAKRKGS